jgi:hypothetical protein
MEDPVRILDYDMLRIPILFFHAAIRACHLLPFEKNPTRNIRWPLGFPKGMHIYSILYLYLRNPEGIICLYAKNKHIIPSGLGKKTIDFSININSLRE